jgi:hypothetical protein
MTSPSIRVFKITLVGSSLLLAACGEQRALLAPEFAVAGATGSAAALPSATYAMTLSLDDFPPGVPPEIVGLLSGDWELDFAAGQTYLIRLNGDVMVQGRYTSNPARLVVHDVAGPLACPGGLAHAVYAWSRNGNTLNLIAVQDRCDGRAFVMMAKPWEIG